jgi:hypothetical protein
MVAPAAAQEPEGADKRLLDLVRGQSALCDRVTKTVLFFSTSIGTCEDMRTRMEAIHWADTPFQRGAIMAYLARIDANIVRLHLRRVDPDDATKAAGCALALDAVKRFASHREPFPDMGSIGAIGTGAQGSLMENGALCGEEWTARATALINGPNAAAFDSDMAQCKFGLKYAEGDTADACVRSVAALSARFESLNEPVPADYNYFILSAMRAQMNRMTYLFVQGQQGERGCPDMASIAQLPDVFVHPIAHSVAAERDRLAQQIQTNVRFCDIGAPVL